jgi:hypothetical protein
MAHIDWQSIMNGQSQQKKRYSGANVKFFNAYNENREKTLKEGRPIFDEIPSISIQWPGGDETVRRIEPQDVQDYPELYKAFTAGNEPVESGTPLKEWALLSGSAVRELNYLGFKTVEQFAEANDSLRPKLGPLFKFVKMAQDWITAANTPQSEVVQLKQLLEREQKRTQKLKEQLELLMQRVEANEGTSLRSPRKEVIQESEGFEDQSDDVEEESPKRRGRPRKV